MYASILYIFNPPKVQQDKQLEEFLRGKIHCQNFINQDLTFLQPPVTYVTQPKEDSILPEKNTIAIPPTTTQENNFPQEQNEHSPQVSPGEVLYDRSQTNNTAAPIQPEEPVVGLTPQEQHRKEEDPDLTLTELLGLTPCEEHITTPLHILDGLYINQSSRFLPLAQEAKKLTRKLKEEEEASQWSGIPIEKLLNDSLQNSLTTSRLYSRLLHYIVQESIYLKI